MTRPDIEAIRQRADAAMPGPWAWHGNVENWTIRLASYNPPRRFGESTVMDFVRWGMKRAVPRFQDERQWMRRAGDDPMPVYDVCRDCTDRAHPRVYRGDFVELRHPDAQFIAHARQDVDDLLAYIAELEALTC